MDTSLWNNMHSRPRVAFDALQAEDLPGDSPGVYALYRNGAPVYVGLAASQSLRARVWNSHRGRGRSMTGSALRRNVAELLGIASSADIKARRYSPTTEDARRVVEWLDGCEISWVRCAVASEASDLESAMKAELLPLLTKR